MIFIALHLIVVGAILVVSLMLLLWVLYLRLDNASVVDPGWALGLAILGLTYALLGPGYFWRRWLGAGMAIVWGLRLAIHLFRRIVGKPEEGRYQQIRKDWGGNLNLKFLGFFEMQAFLDVLLSMPFLLAALNSSPRLHATEYLAVAVWVAAMCGEILADAQLAEFKRDPANRGAVCQRGLWQYSRHPNFFFEWLIWVAWALFASASAYGWLAWICPGLMLYFLLRVTGIPMTEAQAIRSKGDLYREYQRTTSAFIPWFKRGGAQLAA